MHRGALPTKTFSSETAYNRQTDSLPLFTLADIYRLNVADKKNCQSKHAKQARAIGGWACPTFVTSAMIDNQRMSACSSATNKA